MEIKLNETERKNTNATSNKDTPREKAKKVVFEEQKRIQME